ncbi:MAG: hypothetical protein ACKO2G_02055 [Verrucomicrobiales bacterium]
MAICLIGFFGHVGMIGFAFLGYALFALVLYDFQKRLDEGLPLIQLVGVLATLQWVIGPLLAYNADLDFGKYSMRVGEEVYFSYALPGTAAMLAGLYLTGAAVRQREVLRLIAPRVCLWMGLVLGAISLVGEIASRFGPETLKFGFLLLSQLRYIGALYLFRWRSPWRWPLIGLYLFPLVSQTAESAMFHDLLIWLAIVFCYWFALKRRSLKQKWVGLAATAFFVFTIQSIKSSYRDKVWAGEKASFIDEVANFWSSKENFTSDYTKAGNIIRINQGWIIATVLSYVPDSEPHANGDTVVTAVSAALIPRFLDPDKEGAGGRENFMRFTGLILTDNTSMGISPLGEAYANFGVFGGIIAMLVYGLLFGLAVRYCFQFSLKHPHFIFWIPLIFYQAIKAETELVSVLNQITKGGLLAFGCYWMVHTYFLPLISGHGTVDAGRRPRKGRRKPQARMADSQIGVASAAGTRLQPASPYETGDSR